MGKQVVIVGGGFAGVACALKLARYKIPGMKIRLISAGKDFQYHAAMYRVVTGSSPMEVCIPLREIFDKYENVEVVHDRVLEVNLEKGYLCGATECDYTFDELVLALGSETNYYGTPGLEELSFGYNTIDEALKLKKHVQNVLRNCADEEKGEQIDDTRFVVVGGGPSGVEVAAELIVYAKKLAVHYGLDPSLITVDLIQSPNRLVPFATEAYSRWVEDRLRFLGVNVYVNRRVVKEDVDEVFLKDMSVQTKTVIWTAGVIANQLYSQIEGLQLSKARRVEVTDRLRAKGYQHVWIAGDGAEVEDSGLAQSALAMGQYVARGIAGERVTPYKPGNWVIAIPAGKNWAAVEWKGWHVKGLVGWWLRRLLDWAVFEYVLPSGKAFQAMRSGGEEWEYYGR